MIRCPGCQHDNPQGARFCEECAGPLTRYVHELRDSPSGLRQVLPRLRPSRCRVAGAPSRAPDRYTLSTSPNRILTAKAVLEGERKQVTVLFADLLAYPR